MASNVENVVLNFSNEDLAYVMDSFSRLDANRRIQPIDQNDYIEYEHRIGYDDYNLLIGDCFFLIPPETIVVATQTPTQKTNILRQENQFNIKSGYHSRVITITIPFNSLDEMNGFKVPAPKHELDGKIVDYQYVDGLRQLLAQFKYTPFLPIKNELLNTAYGIFNVALQTIRCELEHHYPSLIRCTLMLQEVNLSPYFCFPDFSYSEMIDWDLFRYHIQTFMTDEHEYRKFQKLPKNKDYRTFRLSVLNEELLRENAYIAYGKGKNILEVITDDQYYMNTIDSEENEIELVSFTFGYENVLTQMQYAIHSSPTFQYLGGINNMYHITFETKNIETVALFEQLNIKADLTVRNNPKFKGYCGFVKMQCDLMEFTGSLFVMIEGTEIATVPGQPGLYRIIINCISYDIAQAKRESLSGFLPFEGKASYGKYDNSENNQSITQDRRGLATKIKQDSFAEHKLKSEIELYPDLRLPTYEELNKAIVNIREFRANNNLTQLEYSEYPINPTIMLHGIDINNPPAFSGKHIATPNTAVPTSADISPNFLADIAKIVLQGGKYVLDTAFSMDVVFDSGLDTGHGHTIVNYIDNLAYCNSADYNYFVDPDFYVFYPVTNEEMAEDYNNLTEGITEPNQTEPIEQEITVIDTSMYSEANQKRIEPFINIIRSHCSGHTYKHGEEGYNSDKRGRTFDNFGMLTFALKKLGIIPNNSKPIDSNALKTFNIFKLRSDKNKEINDDGEKVIVNNSKWARGDILYHPKLDDICIITKWVDKENIKVIQGNPTPGYSSDPLIVEESSHINHFSDYVAFMCIPLYDNAFVFNPIKTSNEYDEDEYERTSLNENQDDTSHINSLSNDIDPDLIVVSESEEDWKALQKDASVTSSIRRIRTLDDVAIAGIMGVAESDPNATSQSVWNEIKDDETTINNLKRAKTPEEAAQIVAHRHNVIKGEADYNGVSSNKANSSLKRSSASARDYYNKYSVEKTKQADISGLSKTVSSNSIRNKGINEEVGETVPGTLKYNGPTELTQDEFNSIARCVAKQCEGEPKECKVAVAQMLFDRFTIIDKRWGGISNICQDPMTISMNSIDSVDSQDMSEAISATYYVWCEGGKYRSNRCIYHYLDENTRDISYELRDNKYTKIGSEGTKTFFGLPARSVNVVFKVEGYGSGQASNNDSVEKRRKRIRVDNLVLERFGYPIFFRTSLDSINRIYGDRFEKEVNSDENRFNTSFVDEVQYSARGRLLRAFPTFMFCILDDQAQWFDGRKLWTNYYVYKSVIGISCHSSNDMPISTCQLTVTNIYSNLDRAESNLQDYTIYGDPEYGDKDQWFTGAWFYKTFGILPGSIKLTKKLIDLHQILYNHAQLREDSRVHIRAGYGSDPFNLPVIINGNISDIQHSNSQIDMVIVSDGHELIQGIMDAKPGDTNSTPLIHSQESSDIIADVMVKRANWGALFNLKIFDFDTRDFGEASKYHIEHYGLYIRSNWWLINYEKQFGSNIYKEYDLLKNIYRAAVGKTLLGLGDEYKCSNYMYPLSDGISNFIGADGEDNITFCRYNMTPWDIFNLLAQHVPEFIVKTGYHQFDSRIYYGLPHWMERYRYDITTDGVYEECKAAAQVHYIDSMSDIIDNRMGVSGKRHHSNVKVMYIRGKTPMTTGVIHSDITIDNSKQSTVILDTSIQQNIPGPDAVYEILGFKLGRNSARRVGVSDLLSSWSNEYYGQIITIGNTSIKPNDYIMIYDAFVNLYGVARVNEVVHNFDINHGLTSAISVGMIGFNTWEQTGQIEHVINLWKILQGLVEYSSLQITRMVNYEKYRDILGTYVYELDDYNRRVVFNKTVSFARDVAGVAHVAARAPKYINLAKDLWYGGKALKNIETGFDIIAGVKGVWMSLKTTITISKDATKLANIFRAIKAIAKIKDAAEMARTFFRAATLGTNALKVILELTAAGKTVVQGGKIMLSAAEIAKIAKVAGTTKEGVQAALLGAGSFGSLPGIIIAVCLDIAINVLLDSIFEYFEQRNVVKLVPLIYYGKPYVSGIKCGENILLFSSGNGSEEDVKDKVEIYEDESEPFVEDN